MPFLLIFSFVLGTSTLTLAGLPDASTPSFKFNPPAGPVCQVVNQKMLLVFNSRRVLQGNCIQYTMRLFKDLTEWYAYAYAWKGTTHLLFRGGYKSYCVGYFRLTSVFLFRMLDYVSCMHWPKGWDVWIFFVFLAITLKVEDLADGWTPVNLDRSKNGDGFRDKEAMTEAAMLYEWLRIGLFLLLSVSLFLGKLVCMYGVALALNTATRGVRGTSKWLAWTLGLTSVSCCVVPWTHGPLFTVVISLYPSHDWLKMVEFGGSI